MGAGFQRAITCFIWTQNRGEKPGEIRPENGACSGDTKSISAERGWGSPGPCKRRPVLERGARGARCPCGGEGKSGVQEASRQRRSRGGLSLRGIGVSRGPGGLSIGALTGRHAGMARKIEAFFQAICSCFFSPAAAPPAEARGDPAPWAEAVPSENVSIRSPLRSEGR